MRIWSLLLACCVAAFMAAATEESLPPKTHPDSSGWENLFAEDLSNAVGSKEAWSFKDGVWTPSEDKYIWTQKQYENFILDLEFKMAKGGNSGVFIYCSDLEKWLTRSLEVQLFEDHDAKDKKPASSNCGGIYGRLPPKKIASKPAGEWNRLTITCLGKKIYVLLNGEQVVEMDLSLWTSAEKNPDGSDVPKWIKELPPCELPTKGHVGLQGKHGGVPVHFRNIKIKELK